MRRMRTPRGRTHPPRRRCSRRRRAGPPARRAAAARRSARLLATAAAHPPPSRTSGPSPGRCGRGSARRRAVVTRRQGAQRAREAQERCEQGCEWGGRASGSLRRSGVRMRPRRTLMTGSTRTQSRSAKGAGGGAARGGAADAGGVAGKGGESDARRLPPLPAGDGDSQAPSRARFRLRKACVSAMASTRRRGAAREG
jgi:hypothetical protein